MANNLDLFSECVRNAPASPGAEKFVRIMLGKFAENCPVHVLVQLGQCLVDIRTAELRREAEQN